MIKHVFERIVTAVLVLLFAATQAQANGFQLPEQGVRAMGMGNAFTAVADDASAMWYNPAGIAFLKGGNFMLGAVGIIVPKVDFISNSSNTVLGAGVAGSSDRKSFVSPHFHATFTDPKMGVSYGLSVTSPFGLETDWSFSPLGTKTFPASVGSTTFSRIEMVNVNPNVALKITDHISIAAGFDYVYIKDVDFNKTIVTQNGDGDGWGGNIGFLYKDDMFSAGVSYRTQVAVRITGTASASSPLGTTIGSASISSVKLPEMVNGGIAFHPTDTLTISAEADWTNWSKFDQLAFNYSPALALVGATSVTPEEWHPTVAAKVGIEWEANDDLRLRLGYNFDPSPVNAKNFTPALNLEDRHIFAVGAGYDFTKALTIDVAYMFVKQKDINQTLSTGSKAIRNGHYESNAHLAGLSVNYKF
ncbi:MAG: outer membrane protein transport protein [Mariprofundaceae bacterium]|nr:outer membrane protein transport protein [Mariprofundaceae bacterium]